MTQTRPRPVTFVEIDGGKGCSLMVATPGPDLAAHGYLEREYTADGAAEGLTPAGAVDPAEFVTRVIVRSPASGFSGVVIVEWLNVSSGADAAPEYTYLAPEIVRAGHAWVGVSAQFAGVAGGVGSVGEEVGATAMSLADRDPERYGALHHPGDAFCHGIFTAIGAAIRSPGPGVGPFSTLTVDHVLAVGESQSAMALTTYVNTVAPTVPPEHGFDGYLIHSRSLAGLPLGDAGSGVDITGSFTGAPTHLRDDLRAPVFVLQTETDMLTDFRYHLARQPDTDRLRVWEMAGTSHADLVQIGPFEEMLGCPTPVNRGQQRFVLRAALRHLVTWIDGGAAPPTAPPLEIDATVNPPRLAVDSIGNAVAGVRTPCVDVATQVLSGIAADPPSRICLLFGSTLDADPDLLARRYGTPEQYMKEYEKAVNAAIADGFMLTDDLEEILADARPDLVPTDHAEAQSP